MVYDVEDDVAGIICQARVDGAARQPRQHHPDAEGHAQTSGVPRAPGRGVIEIKYSTDFDSPFPPHRCCMSIHPEERSRSDIGLVLVLNDPPGR